MEKSGTRPDEVRRSGRRPTAAGIATLHSCRRPRGPSRQRIRRNLAGRSLPGIASWVSRRGRAEPRTWRPPTIAVRTGPPTMPRLRWRGSLTVRFDPAPPWHGAPFGPVGPLSDKALQERRRETRRRSCSVCRSARPRALSRICRSWRVSIGRSRTSRRHAFGNGRWRAAKTRKDNHGSSCPSGHYRAMPGRPMDELHEAAGPETHGPDLRPSDRRISRPHRHPEPPCLPRHRRHRTRRLSRSKPWPSGVPETNARPRQTDPASSRFRPDIEAGRAEPAFFETVGLNRPDFGMPFSTCRPRRCGPSTSLCAFAG